MTITTPVLDLNRAVDPDLVSIARRRRRAFELIRDDRGDETVDEVILLLEDAVLDRELAIRS